MCQLHKELLGDEKAKVTKLNGEARQLAHKFDQMHTVMKELNLLDTMGQNDMVILLGIT